MDLNERYVGCNHSFSQFIGKNYSEISGKTSDEIRDPESAFFLTSRNQKLLNNPGMLTYIDTITITGKTSHEVTIQKSTFSVKERVTAGINGITLSNRVNKKYFSVS